MPDQLAAPTQLVKPKAAALGHVPLLIVACNYFPIAQPAYIRNLWWHRSNGRSREKLLKRFAWHEIGTEHQHVDVDLVVGFENTAGPPIMEADRDHFAVADRTPPVGGDG